MGGGREMWVLREEAGWFGPRAITCILYAGEIGNKNINYNIIRELHMNNLAHFSHQQRYNIIKKYVNFFLNQYVTSLKIRRPNG